MSSRILARPVLVGQLILHLEEYKLDSKGKQEDEDHNVVSTHCQPPAMTTQLTRTSSQHKRRQLHFQFLFVKMNFYTEVTIMTSQ